MRFACMVMSFYVNFKNLVSNNNKANNKKNISSFHFVKLMRKDNKIDEPRLGDSLIVVIIPLKTL